LEIAKLADVQLFRELLQKWLMRSFAACDLLQKWRMRIFAAYKLLQKWRLCSYATCINLQKLRRRSCAKCVLLQKWRICSFVYICKWRKQGLARLCCMYTFSNGGGKALLCVNCCKNCGCPALPHPPHVYFFTWLRHIFACKLLQKWRMRVFAACILFQMVETQRCHMLPIAKMADAQLLPHVNFLKWRRRRFAACDLLQKWRMRSFAACRRGHQVWHPADEKGKHDVTSPAL
jgi:hypothetical protein